MYRCWVENEYNEKLELTNNKHFKVYQIDGLDPPTATINTATVANFDGTTFNSSRANERNIVIYMSVEGNCEEARAELYKHVKAKRAVRFYYQNDTRNVHVDGYVESILVSLFEQKQTAQVSIICPRTWLQAEDESREELSSIEPMFVFPFAYTEEGAPFSVTKTGEQRSIINAGDIENGVIIRLTARGSVINPAVYNLTKGEWFKLSTEMEDGDEITIDTRKGHKAVRKTANGAITNAINDMVVGSTWFQLRTGDNIFECNADSYPENLVCEFTWSDEFEGV